jgi:CelD/BcsL family acetyltransferase involved in cellulose biosynthesis
VQLTLHSDPEIFARLRPEWDTLFAHSAARLLFLSWEWASTWWNAYQPGELAIVSVRDDAGALVGLAPWFIESRHDDSGAVERVLRTIGCVDVTDYLDILTMPDHHAAVIEALAGLLADQRPSFSRLNLCNIPVDSLTLASMPDALTARGFAVEVQQQEVCPQIALPATWDGYLESLDKKQRHELRRKIRRMDGERVEYRVITEAADLSAHIELFLDLMRASHPEKAAFLDDPGHDAFFRALLPVMAARGWLRLSFLLVEDTPCASYCHFDYEGHILVYNSGLNPEQFAHLSPGIVLLCRDIEWAIQNGRALFDFLRGNEGYKYRMGGIDRAVYMIMAH